MQDTATILKANFKTIKIIIMYIMYHVYVKHILHTCMQYTRMFVHTRACMTTYKKNLNFKEA